MNRTDAILWQSRLFGGYELPDICMQLRMGVNGAADEWRPEAIEEAVDMLQARLDTWTPSYPRFRAFDNAVRQLVQATIDEVRDYDWWQYANEQRSAA